MPGKSKNPKKSVQVTDLDASKKGKDVKGGALSTRPELEEASFIKSSSLKITTKT